MTEFRQFRAAWSELKGLANDQQTSAARRQILDRVSALEARARTLSPDERVDLAADYLQLQQPQKAVDLLAPLAREGSTNSFLLANLATAYDQSGHADRAIDALQSSLKNWPRMHAGWSTAQLDWARRCEQKYLDLLRERRQIALRQRGVGQNSLSLDELFPGLRYVGDSGEFEAGALAVVQRDKLPTDAVALIQQLLLWTPYDAALAWQLAEALNARGDVGNAATILDDLVFIQRVQSRDLRRHQQALDDARKTAAAVRPRLQSGELAWWLQPRGQSAVGGPVTPLLNEAVWTGVLTEVASRDARADAPPQAAASNKVAEASAAPIDGSWLPSPAKAMAVGGLAGIVIGALGCLQVRELWHRRRRSAAPLRR